MTKKQKQIYEQTKSEMIELKNNSDIELRHVKADDLLCKLLNEFGCHEVTDIFESLTKWYA